MSGELRTRLFPTVASASAGIGAGILLGTLFLGVPWWYSFSVGCVGLAATLWSYWYWEPPQ